MHEVLPEIDFAAHARKPWARWREKVVVDRRTRDAPCKKARSNTRTTVIVIDTDPLITTDAGGHWWDVAVPEVSTREPGARRAQGI